MHLVCSYAEMMADAEWKAERKSRSKKPKAVSWLWLCELALAPPNGLSVIANRVKAELCELCELALAVLTGLRLLCEIVVLIVGPE